MEENEDSIKESIKKEDDPFKKDIFDNDSSKEKSTLINKNPRDLNNEVLGDETSKNLINDPNNEKFDEENSNKLNNVINKNKVEEKNLKTLNIKPKKEPPIEKKPFNEFINDHLLPSIIEEFKVRGFEVSDINLKNTSRPIAGDKCWVIYCEIKEICNFWLSFEKEDISSLKSISLCKSDQKPSVIESFLIDEKRITLKLIISRILQRLNGQKLIGIN